MDRPNSADDITTDTFPYQSCQALVRQPSIPGSIMNTSFFNLHKTFPAALSLIYACIHIMGHLSWRSAAIHYLIRLLLLVAILHAESDNLPLANAQEGNFKDLADHDLQNEEQLVDRSGNMTAAAYYSNDTEEKKSSSCPKQLANKKSKRDSETLRTNEESNAQDGNVIGCDQVHTRDEGSLSENSGTTSKFEAFGDDRSKKVSVSRCCTNKETKLEKETSIVKRTPTVQVSKLKNQGSVTIADASSQVKRTDIKASIKTPVSAGSSRDTTRHHKFSSVSGEKPKAEHIIGSEASPKESELFAEKNTNGSVLPGRKATKSLVENEKMLKTASATADISIKLPTNMGDAETDNKFTNLFAALLGDVRDYRQLQRQRSLQVILNQILDGTDIDLQNLTILAKARKDLQSLWNQSDIWLSLFQCSTFIGVTTLISLLLEPHIYEVDPYPNVNKRLVLRSLHRWLVSIQLFSCVVAVIAYLKRREIKRKIKRQTLRADRIYFEASAGLLPRQSTQLGPSDTEVRFHERKLKKRRAEEWKAKQES